jgi:hypothetical protein
VKLVDVVMHDGVIPQWSSEHLAHVVPANDVRAVIVKLTLGPWARE